MSIFGGRDRDRDGDAGRDRWIVDGIEYLKRNQAMDALGWTGYLNIDDLYPDRPTIDPDLEEEGADRFRHWTFSERDGDDGAYIKNVPESMLRRPVDATGGNDER